MPRDTGPYLHVKLGNAVMYAANPPELAQIIRMCG